MGPRFPIPGFRFEIKDRRKASTWPDLLSTSVVGRLGAELLDVKEPALDPLDVSEPDLSRSASLVEAPLTLEAARRDPADNVQTPLKE